MLLLPISFRYWRGGCRGLSQTSIILLKLTHHLLQYLPNLFYMRNRKFKVGFVWRIHIPQLQHMAPGYYSVALLRAAQFCESNGNFEIKQTQSHFFLCEDHGHFSKGSVCSISTTIHTSQWTNSPVLNGWTVR